MDIFCDLKISKLIYIYAKLPPQLGRRSYNVNFQVKYSWFEFWVAPPEWLPNSG